jgi:mRNA-binding protein PUF3
MTLTFNQQARARPGPFGIGPSSSNNVSNKGFGSGFSSGSGAWNEGIWSDKVIGSGMKSGIQDTGRAQSQSSSRWVSVQCDADRLEDGLQVSGSSGAITGSGSLLSSSESEGFNLRQGSWKSVEDPSPGLSRVHTNGSSTSSMHHQNSNQLNTHSFNDTNSANSTYFSLTPTSTNISSRPSQKNFLDPTSGSFVAATSDPSSLSRASRHNSDEETRFAARKMAFEGTDTGLIMQSTRPSFNNNVTGYNGSTAASRSGSMPPSRGDVDPSMRYPNDISQYSRYNESAVHGQNHLSAQAPSYTMPAKSTGQKHPDHFSPSQLSQLLGEFGNLSVGKDIPQNCYPTESEASYAMSSGHGNGYTQNLLLEGNDIWRKDDNGYPTQQDQFSPTGSGSGSLSSHQGARRGANFGAQYSQSSSVSDARLGHNLYYSTTGTPPTYQPRVPSRGGFSNGTLVTGQAALLERRLRGLQQEQQTYIVPRGTQMHYSNQISHLPAYDFHPQPGFRMNHINPYYPMPPIPHQMAAQNIPRGPAREHDVVQPVRSTLLEEFRNNSKTNKRYELKVSFDSHILTSAFANTYKGYL